MKTFLVLFLGLLATGVPAQDGVSEKAPQVPADAPSVSLSATADRRTFSVAITSRAPVYLSSIEILAQGTGLAGLASFKGEVAGTARMRNTAGNYARVIFFVGSMIPAGTSTFSVTLPGSPFYISLAFREAVLWSPTRDDLVLDAITVGASIGEPKKVSTRVAKSKPKGKGKARGQSRSTRGSGKKKIRSR